MDDLLTDPGISLGEYVIGQCADGLALLGGISIDGMISDDPIYALASALLAAELNLNVGAETCPAAEEAAVGAHLVLSNADFNGKGTYLLTDEAENALPKLVNLLTFYNNGTLCQ